MCLYHDNKQEYLQKKTALAQAVQGRIIAKFPGFKGNLKILDVFTPKTLNRYTNASRGAYMGFLFTAKDPVFSFNGKVKGLKNFLLAGQWAQCPGGLPLALASGKFAIQRICKMDKQSLIVSPSKILAKKIAS